MANPTILDTSSGTQEDETVALHSGSVALQPDPVAAQVAEPDAKRLKSSCPSNSIETIPQVFMAKWVATPRGILPFVKNMETGLVHCGFTKMNVLHFKDTSGCGDVWSVICLSGCNTVGECPRDGNSNQECACFCHILQKDYDSRLQPWK